MDERVFRIALTLDEIDLIKKCIDDHDQIALQEAMKFFELDDSDLEKLLNEPFNPKTIAGGKPFPESRFSNGDYAVFYSAQEQETAGEEYAHTAPTYVPESMRAVELRLHLITCRFSGIVKDMRPLSDAFPGLTADAHDFCRELGREAVAQDQDGLFSRSVRHKGGTSVPVFKRRCLSEPQNSGVVICSIDAVTKTATCTITT